MTAKEYEEWKVYLSYEPTNTTEIQLASLITLVGSFMGVKSSVADNMVSTRPKKKPKKIDGATLNNVIKGMFG